VAVLLSSIAINYGLGLFRIMHRTRGHFVPVLDLRRALLDAKSRTSYLYSATDTHWNASGAYVAYREVILEIAKKRPDMHFAQRSRGRAVTDVRRLLLLAAHSISGVTQSVALKPAMIAEYNPTVVLFEMVERKLNNSPPQDP
jgi:SGNH hydrolase-like domain, acetyltransferase AlgX